MDPTESNLTQPTVHAADEPGQPSPKAANSASGLTCPECHSSLWELNDGDRSRFECRVGHAYSLEALSTEQGEAVEAALWSAVNALQERATTLRRLGERRGGRHQASFFERAELTERLTGALLDLLRRLLADDEGGSRDVRAARAPTIQSLAFNCLTPREREVLQLIALGHTNRQIADRLVLSRGTVANHVAHMLAKLALDNRTQLAAVALRPNRQRDDTDLATITSAIRTPAALAWDGRLSAPPAPLRSRASLH
jgi:DNA-binding CsgD family transcriptional regulator